MLDDFDKVNEKNDSADDSYSEKEEIHTLTIRSNLYNDNVYIDGVSKGSTPITLKMPSDNYRILVKKSGYEQYVDDINLNSSKFIYADLKPIFHVNMYSEMIKKVYLVRLCFIYLVSIIVFMMMFQ